MLDKIQVHAEYIQYATQNDLHVYNIYMYILLNFLCNESLWYISWSVDHAHGVIVGACNSLDTEMKTCMSKGLAFGSFYMHMANFYQVFCFNNQINSCKVYNFLLGLLFLHFQLLACMSVHCVSYE